jgi:hypothetical protein
VKRGEPANPKRRTGAITAAELVEQLDKDDGYQLKKASREAELKERAAVVSAAEQPIVAHLRDVGVVVESVWDLVNTATPYPDALPVLMDHLERGGYPDRVMQGLGRALAVKPSIAYWDRLKSLYLAARGPEEVDGIAVALAACATKEQFGDLVGFLSVEPGEPSRIYFLQPILRLGGTEGRRVVAALAEDPVFGKEATALLSRTK